MKVTLRAKTATVNEPDRIPMSSVGVYAPDGHTFLGVRSRRDGVLEVIHERFGVRKSVWQVRSGNPSLDGLKEACRRAVEAEDPLATLYSALATSGIRLECVEEKFILY